MQKFYEKITAKPLLIVMIFLVISVICGISSKFVSVNYDMNAYLPDESQSTVSLDVMNKEFDGGIPNVRAMVPNVTIAEALQYKEKFEAISGVSDVTWLDDAISILEPLETQDTETIETYYKDGNALFSITVEEDSILDAVAEIRSIVGDQGAMTGSAVSTEVATNSTVSEISKIVVIAVLIVIAILFLTTNSWVQPAIIMAGLGIAILINRGSNLLFGEISFVSNAAGSILQLAVSLDYSVFLMHRFEEYRKDYANPKDAMVEALCKSTSSILSSGMTTVIGFLALCLMQFKIGPDLGLVLAKGVAISLISVFTLLPCIILLTYKWIDKTEHRPLLPSFEKFGKGICKCMIPCVAIFVVAIVPSYLASNANSFYYGSSHIFGKETKLGADTETIEKIFGKNDTYVLLVPKDTNVTQQKLSAELQKLPEVTGIISYVDTVGEEIPEEYLDEDTYSKLVSKHYSRMVLSLDTDYEGSDTFALVKEIRSIAKKYYGKEYYLAGNGVSTYDLMDTVTKDMVKVNLIAIGAVFLVLLVSMKSVLLPLLLVLSIETAIWINLAIPYFSDQSIFYIAYLIISSIQLGSTVDYAILMTDRYMEKREVLPKREAIIQTISSCTVSILTSGITLVAVGFLMGYISTHGLLAQLGIFMGRGAVCSLLIVFFVLPGLLYLFDRFIIKKKKVPVSTE